MFYRFLLSAALFLFSLTVHSGEASASLYQFDLSPNSADALNLGATTYGGDVATGLSGLNSLTPGSPATGGVLGGGIVFDDVTNQLTFDFGFGSAFGFVDLVAPYTAGHIHGPADVGVGGGVQVNLAPFLSLNTPVSGRYTGVTALSAAQETMLFDNLLYINIHSGAFPGGEIRGQLVGVSVVPEPGSAALLGMGFLMLAGARRRRAN